MTTLTLEQKYLIGYVSWHCDNVSNCKENGVAIVVEENPEGGGETNLETICELKEMGLIEYTSKQDWLKLIKLTDKGINIANDSWVNIKPTLLTSSNGDIFYSGQMESI